MTKKERIAKLTKKVDQLRKERDWHQASLTTALKLLTPEQLLRYRTPRLRGRKT